MLMNCSMTLNQVKMQFDSKQTVMRPRCPMQKSMSQQMENVMYWMKEGKFKHKKKD